MNENRYVYVSARIRVLEGRLLSEEDFGQLEAASFRQCLRLLAGRGWEPGRDGTDVEGMFGREREKVRRVFQSLGEVRAGFPDSADSGRVSEGQGGSETGFLRDETAARGAKGQSLAGGSLYDGTCLVETGISGGGEKSGI